MQYRLYAEARPIGRVYYKAHGALVNYAEEATRYELADLPAAKESAADHWQGSQGAWCVENVES